MNYLNQIIIYFETQNLQGIKECFNNGVDPNAIVNEQPLLYSLINMYSRGPLFKQEVKLFVEAGLKFDDAILLSVWLDDATSLDVQLNANKEAINKKYSLPCTYTPLYEASLLHICAEYNHVSCAKVLVKHGADVNVKAGFDENGFGGQTPIFHTVNQHNNLCIDMMHYLLSQKTDLSLTVKGLIWGKTYEWETFIPSVNPVSYAMMGLLRQFQRTEPQIYEIVSALMKAKYNTDYLPTNIPNKYLADNKAGR